MQRYGNFTGESTITHYEIGDGYIRIKYKKEIIEYRASSNSPEVIEEMKALAKTGNGLSRYIMKNKVKREQAIEEVGIYQRLKSIFS